MPHCVNLNVSTYLISCGPEEDKNTSQAFIKRTVHQS